MGIFWSDGLGWLPGVVFRGDDLEWLFEVVVWGLWGGGVGRCCPLGWMPHL